MTPFWISFAYGNVWIDKRIIKPWGCEIGQESSPKYTEWMRGWEWGCGYVSRVNIGCAAFK
jgi:hypothetical protein